MKRDLTPAVRNQYLSRLGNEHLDCEWESENVLL